MKRFELIQKLKQISDEKIVMLVLDGLGGLPKNGKTELEAAETPNIDSIAKNSDTGLMTPIIPGITPGSGPGHLALFGYDPLEYIIGRGILSALGVKFPIRDGDLAARVNFATIDKNGMVTDRRAGRIPDDINRKMCEMIRQLKIPGVEFFIETEKDHRAALIFRGSKLSENISETDPQKTGVAPLPVKPMDSSKASIATAELINKFLQQVRKKLQDEHPANMILLRGFALFTEIPSFQEVYGLNACAIAGYPMYRGLASLVGMKVIEVDSGVIPQFNKLKELWGKYNFYFIHIKYTDSYGEDGNFDKKAAVITEVDRNIDKILDLEPDVFVITADHSTPATYKAHSWHPVPVLLKSKWSRKSCINKFGETQLLKGTLGIINTPDLMTLIMANSGRLAKFGA
ncbi:MAG: 2,3-bisphosphoglycerate-independent phosphoglycerate mutase [Spirochaetes bacterium]|nr:2,3-bisphosphoglycerate-independent phosphoglycerate mutase [Spirochaetota bacterium]